MHSNSIANIAKVFSKAGYEVIALDLRGHGKSGGKKGFLESPKILLDDIKQFIKQTETLGEYKNIQNKFILGYSLGGLLSSLICIEQKDHFNGMLLISPPFLDVMKDTNTYIKIARLLNNLVPSLPLMPIKRVEERKDIQEYIKNDPLIYKGRIRIGTIVTVLDSIKEHLRKIDEVKTPFFLLHGNNDKICRPEGSSIFFKEAKISDKTFLQLDSK
jgi:alpha-beta hydrolase superfamily lysophospholipase